jgi:3-phosphoshikimate 1-carboxyvinyltransferase
MVDVVRVPTAPGPVDAVVAVPGSKSIANRMLVCAALADGDSVLHGVPDGDDTAAMVECLGALGVIADLSGDVATVAGTGGRIAGAATHVTAHLAGTTSRFVTALAALGPGPTIVDGEPPLRRRPMAPLHDELASLGVAVRPLDGPGRLPVEVSGPPTGGTVSVRGDVSSQFITALMLIGPYLPDGLDLELTTDLVSRPYVEITAEVMGACGAHDVSVGEGAVHVPRGRYHGGRHVVEPDASSASYPLALAAIGGGRVEVPGLEQRALQGDAAFADLLALMGCTTTWTAGGVVVERDPATTLRGIDIDMAGMSDLVPTLAAVAVTASTPTRIRGVGFVRAKESDRLGDLAAELRKAGASIEVTDDGLHVEPVAELHRATLSTHHDHRLAMAFAVLGAAVDGIVIEDPGVVSKSWPGFWDAYDDLLASNPEPD